MMVRTRHFVVDHGIRLVGDVSGDAAAPCVVLMHGGGQTRYSWLKAGRTLAEKGYQVVNFDARGHGESDWAGPGGYSIARHAADLRAIVSEVEGPVALVGASLGGVTALRAMADGIRPAAVVLVDIVPNPDLRGVERIRDFMLARPEGFASLEEAADAIASYNPHRPRPADLSGLRNNLRRHEDGRYRWHWDPAFLGRDPADEIEDLARTIEGARVARDIPVLLVRGGNSDVVNAEGMAVLSDVLPGIEVAEVAGAGHMVAGDRNDAFNVAVLEFLGRHFPVEGSRA